MDAVDLILRAALPWLVGALVVSCAAPGPGPPFDLTTAVVSDETTGQLIDVVCGYRYTESITVVSGESDTVCEPWQQRDGVELLRDAGYRARLVSVPAADQLTLSTTTWSTASRTSCPTRPQASV